MLFHKLYPKRRPVPQMTTIAPIKLAFTNSSIPSLKTHRDISKRRCFEKFCCCDQACQFSVLEGTPWRSYLEKNWQWRQIYKKTSLTFYTSNDVLAVSKRKNYTATLNTPFCWIRHRFYRIAAVYPFGHYY